MTDRTVAALAKNSTQELRVRLTEFRRYRLVDVRLFTKYRATGKLGPTRKGITIKVELLSELRQALDQAQAEARAIKWLK